MDQPTQPLTWSTASRKAKASFLSFITQCIIIGASIELIILQLAWLAGNSFWWRIATIGSCLMLLSAWFITGRGSLIRRIIVALLVCALIAMAWLLVTVIPKRLSIPHYENASIFIR